MNARFLVIIILGSLAADLGGVLQIPAPQLLVFRTKIVLDKDAILSRRGPALKDIYDTLRHALHQ